MPYQVFALKWRPGNFAEIIGQDHIVARLKSAIQQKRLGHAYLFAGPRGVGKTSTARILAKALNCQDGPTVTPCQKCPSCLEITAGRSLDVIEIDAASNTGVDNIRDLRESVKFAPASGRFKIYIVDEVHMLSDSAFNALLKTLEEPPPYIKFIFATTHPHKIIPTVLSRCQRFDFRRIPAMVIMAQLERIAASEKIEVAKDVLFTIAKASDGSLRDAESVLDQLFSFVSEKISLPDVVSVLGVVEQETLFSLTDKIIQKDALGVLALLNNIIEEGKDVGVFLASLIEHFRNLMVVKVAHLDPKLIDLPEEATRRLLQQSQNLSLEEIFSAFNILVNAQEMAKRLDSLRIPLEVSLVRLAQNKSSVLSSNPAPKDTAKLKTNKPPEVQVKKEKPPVEISQKAKDLPDTRAQNISLENIKNIWQEVINGLGKIKMSLATYLSEGQPLKVQGNTLTIAFPKDYSLHKESLEEKDNRQIIEKVASELVKANLRFNFVLSPDFSPPKDEGSSTFIKSALDVFNGRVIREDR